MRVTENPGFFAGLPMQSAQWALKEAAGDMSIRSLKSYKAGTPGFTGKPGMPKYKDKATRAGLSSALGILHKKN